MVEHGRRFLYDGPTFGPQIWEYSNFSVRQTIHFVAQETLSEKLQYSQICGTKVGPFYKKTASSYLSKPHKLVRRWTQKSVHRRRFLSQNARQYVGAR